MEVAAGFEQGAGLSRSDKRAAPVASTEEAPLIRPNQLTTDPAAKLAALKPMPARERAVSCTSAQEQMRLKF